MIRFFKRRRPTVQPKVSAGYLFAPAAPTICQPCMTTQEDIDIAHAWDLKLYQWWGLTDFERAECRRLITTAPRFKQ